MCDAFTIALAAIGASIQGGGSALDVVSRVQQRDFQESANKTAAEIARFDALETFEANEDRLEEARASSIQEQLEKTREAFVAQGRAAAVGAERGVTGPSVNRVFREINRRGLEASTASRQNFTNLVRQAHRENRAAARGARSAINSIRPVPNRGLLITSGILDVVGSALQGAQSGASAAGSFG